MADFNVQDWIKLENQSLRHVNPWDTQLSEASRQAIYEECKVNPVYFYFIILRNERSDQLARQQVDLLKGFAASMTPEQASRVLTEIVRPMVGKS